MSQFNCHIASCDTWQNAFEPLQGFVGFLITIIGSFHSGYLLQYVSLSTPVHLLESSKPLFKVTLCWVATVGKFPCEIPRTHKLNSQGGNSVTDVFHLYYLPAGFQHPPKLCLTQLCSLQLILNLLEIN